MQALYSIKGTVIAGQKRGKTLGYPTANIKIEQNIPEGIYASITIIEGTKRNAVTFIGKAETFNETDYKAETYILDCNENLYDKDIEIKLLKKLRDTKKFTSEQQLIGQMKQDVTDALQIFASLPAD